MKKIPTSIAKRYSYGRESRICYSAGRSPMCIACDFNYPLKHDEQAPKPVRCTAPAYLTFMVPVNIIVVDQERRLDLADALTAYFNANMELVCGCMRKNLVCADCPHNKPHMILSALCNGTVPCRLDTHCMPPDAIVSQCMPSEVIVTHHEQPA